MRESVFHRRGQLPECFAVAFRDEERVVTEATRAPVRISDDSLHGAIAVLQHAAAASQDHGAAESRRAGFSAGIDQLQLAKELVTVVGVGGARAGITGGENARRAVERIDLEARVVGEYEGMGTEAFSGRECLDRGVLLEGAGRAL